MPRKKELLKKIEYSRSRKMTPAALTKWIKKLNIPTPGGKIDPEVADRMIAAARDPAYPDRRGPGRPPDPNAGDKRFIDAKTEEMELKIEIRKAELKRIRGELIDREEAEAIQIEREKKIKREILQIRKIAPIRLVGKGVKEIDAILGEMLFEITNKLKTGNA